ncbi:hypothetical protein [Veillonella caviae]|uniref:hypothetical protein n=1 Tax=Veillonella caviae TaxID=248316 RepID=UPI002A90D78B|nr:hypothetical protein [Veillonella caviae]
MFNSNKFMKELQKDIKKAIQSELNSYACNSCHRKFKAKIGKNICPHCKSTINISFEK